MKKSRHNRFTLESLVFLKGSNEECIDALNLMGGDDITQATFDDICKLARNYSRSTLRKDKIFRPLPTIKTSTSVSRVKLRNLLSNINKDIVNHLETQLDTLHPKRKKEEGYVAHANYYPHCR